MDRLGPWPAQAVAAFRDLGLTDHEIARYFRVDPRVVRQVGRDQSAAARWAPPANPSAANTGFEQGFVTRPGPLSAINDGRSRP